jgi:3-oxosteroid 1-dehydrogenase
VDLLNETWDARADFVVLGSGAAGLTGALVAAAGGADVMLVEKSPLIGGTTAMSGGAQWIPVNHHMSEVGVADSREEALEYLFACEGPSANEELLVALVDHGAAMVRHLEDLGMSSPRPWPVAGGTSDYRPWLPGAKRGGRALNHRPFSLRGLGEWSSRIRVGRPWGPDMLEFYSEHMHLACASDARWEGLRPYSVAGAADADAEFVIEGTALIGELLQAGLGHGVQPFVNTRATELIALDGRVVGVRAVHEGKPWRIRARHGVLVATGGYGGNAELKQQWLNRPMLVTCEIDDNEGDGHLMGMAIGAQVANLGDAWWIPFVDLGVDAYGVANVIGSRTDRILPHTMIVNAQGKRFINEATNYYDFAEGFGTSHGAAARNFPAWFIFDQQGVDRYGVLAFKVPPGEPPSWLTVSDSLPELAAKLDIDASSLIDTINRFNQFAIAGNDLDFHRGENPWDAGWGDPDIGANPCLGTIAKPPFYAMKILPGALATKGGLRVNGNAQVLSAAPPFDPIPGLWAAGNCSSGGPARSYPGPGSTIGAAMTFGYLAGREIAELVAVETEGEILRD